MDNSSQEKCSSLFQSSAFPMDFSLSKQPSVQREMSSTTSIHPLVIQGLRSNVTGRVQQPAFPGIFHSNYGGFVHADVHNSFLALLSRPHSQCDYLDLSDLKPCNVSSNSPAATGDLCADFFATGGLPTAHGLRGRNMSSQDLRGDLFQVSSSRATMNGNSTEVSALHDNCTLDPTDAVSRFIGPGGGNAWGSSAFDCGIWDGTLRRVLDVQYSDRQKSCSMELDRNYAIHPTAFMNGHPRVFCSDKSGYLLLSNTGLLGNVCSCHTSRMSVLKFCEHSGMRGANPGDVVCMETGETIAHWRKLYFLMFGIRVPDNESDWDWPEVIPVTAATVRSNVSFPKLSNNCSFNPMVGSSALVTKSRKAFGDVIFPNNIQRDDAPKQMQLAKNQVGYEERSAASTLAIGNSIGKHRKNAHDGQINLHHKLDKHTVKFPDYAPCQKSHSCQSDPGNNLSMRNSYSTIVHPTQFDSSNTLNDPDFMLKNGTSDGSFAALSNFQLRLGQPSWPSGKSVIGTQTSDVIGNSSNLQFTECMAHTSRLNQYLENHTNFMHAAGREKHTDIVAESVASPIPSLNTQSGGRFALPKMPCSKLSSVGGLKWQSEPTSSNINLLMNDGKGMEFINNVFHVDSCSRASMWMQNSSSSVVKGIMANGCNISSRDENISESCLSSLPMSKSTPKFISSTLGNHFAVGKADVTSEFQGTQLSFIGPMLSEGISAGNTFASTNASYQSSNFSRQEDASLDKMLLDGDSRLLAVTQMLELSRQQKALYPNSINQKKGCSDTCSKGLHLQFESSASRWQGGVKSLVCKEKFSECRQNTTSGFGSDVDNLSLITGLDGCKFSSLGQVPLHSKEEGSQHRYLNNPFPNEEESLRLGSGNIMSLNDCRDCCWRSAYAHRNEKCNCATPTDCSGAKVLSHVRFPLYTPGEKMGNAENTSVLVNSDFLKNGNGSHDSNVFSEQIEKNMVVQRGCGSLSYQRKDIPVKLKGVQDSASDLLAYEFHEKKEDSHQIGDTFAKRIKVSAYMNGSLKDQEISQDSSGCCAPSVTQTSFTNKSMDSSIVCMRDSVCTKQGLVDEGSGIGKRCSSDAAESERSAQFLGSPCGADLTEGHSGVLNNQPYCSLLDEVKLLDAMMRKGQDKHLGLNSVSGKTAHPQKIKDGYGGRKRKQIELKMLRTSSNLATPQSLYNEADEVRGVQHRTRCILSVLSSSTSASFKCGFSEGRDGEDNCVTDPNSDSACKDFVEALSRKKLRKDITSVSLTSVIGEESTRKDAESKKLNAYTNMRPVAYGKYGELSITKSAGEWSKPTKIIPLSKVLKAAKRSPPAERNRSKLNYAKGLSSLVSYVYCSKSKEKCTVKISSDHSACDEAIVESDCQVLDERMSKSEVKNGGYKFKHDHVIGDSTQTATKWKCRGTRKRSINELTFEEVKQSSMLESAVNGKYLMHQPNTEKFILAHRGLPITNSDAPCCVCGKSSQEETNCLLECRRCLIKVHQACYGVSLVPASFWCCRPCRTSSLDMACVLCGYGGGAMTRALRSRTIVGSLLKAWKIEDDCRNGVSFYTTMVEHTQRATSDLGKFNMDVKSNHKEDFSVGDLKVCNSITTGVLDSTVKQWVHVVCGLWTPGTRCPNVNTMSAFDVSGVSHPKADVVCSICKRWGGSCIKCRVKNCCTRFHPWCAHQKGMLQSETEGCHGEKVGFYGRCVFHAIIPSCQLNSYLVGNKKACLKEDFTCARIEVYRGRQDNFRYSHRKSISKGGCLVPQEQLIAWIYINGQKFGSRVFPRLPVCDIESDARKEYGRYKQAKGWKRLVVYKSGIHALGLYTSQFICRGEMVVEYVGEIVGLRVADKREVEYQLGRSLQQKSACYFFRIDKENIIDATRKGGIARFVNHSCQPNCEAKVITVRPAKKVVFFAERDIFPGEEITYDYHFNNEDAGNGYYCPGANTNCRNNSCSFLLNLF